MRRRCRASAAQHSGKGFIFGTPVSAMGALPHEQHYVACCFQCYRGESGLRKSGCHGTDEVLYMVGVGQGILRLGLLHA